MHPPKKEHPEEKSGLHPRNKHRARYDFPALIASSPELKPFVQVNAYGDASVDFFNPQAVKALNKALLKHYYGITHWDIPANYLCPPIPGRADYLHHIADLLGDQNTVGTERNIPRGAQVKCLDIGVGANCIYPILGTKEYGWSFVGADIDPVAIKSANNIIQANPSLKGKITCRLQPNAADIFRGIIQPGEQFDLTLCNPPFHASAAEAKAGSLRKVRNLKGQRVAKATLNFGGQHNELWTAGGEAAFLTNLVRQSQEFAQSCFWFSTLVSKSENLKNVYKALEQVNALEVKTLPMHQGNKASRLLAWTFFTPAQKADWVQRRWAKK
ncbi:23S rRNA (adenine(1618)-N(6))-methyltransferase RlmF [Rufibacter quisquiliarum]|uniref:Ribosomal RNA large subunit methyltransferase F n=1 Tax=Rufibacter quisquiliarum TaxID=1549639 RepID=A0A839GJ19_9BACT|nr:23S rRNA (adenine(1618)-N(6))-methyltransferase RlmF [Rufibacter quisquiliarum]MBA9076749.1 23S rRNA (adenine1618-N6)-methyltransferase [Rufibacter quisquiliarum]